jgi:hypothetical protein
MFYNINKVVDEKGKKSPSLIVLKVPLGVTCSQE